MSSNPSDPVSTAANIRDRKIHWREVLKVNVQNGNTGLSLSEEWNRLVKLIVGSTAVVAVGDSSERALQSFKDVFSKGYASQTEFSDDLLHVLHQSLDGYVDITNVQRSNTESNAVTSFTLGNTQLGFASNMPRSNLFGGRKFSYAWSKDNKCDHCCFVTHPQQRQPNGDFIVDVTASVELKHGKTRCRPFNLSIWGCLEYLDEPNLEKDQRSVGQALLYALDCWNCLARRGVSQESIPVVVIGGRSSNSKIKDTDYLCCLGVSLFIPPSLGDNFVYTVNQYVQYTTPNNSYSEMAAAVYIQTMRIGLENATNIYLDICKPVSLCCRSPTTVETSFRLVGSPIPFANANTGAAKWDVSQGEIMKLVTSNNLGIRQLFPAYGFFFTANDNDMENMEDYILIKVSCNTVHKSLVRPDLCAHALETLSRSPQYELIIDVPVLLAYRYNGASGTLISVMRDLSVLQFFLLRPVNIHTANRMGELWQAFCVLVTDVLLPMAEKDVIHVDIRPGWEVTYNLLCCDHKNSFELRLIDYESLVRGVNSHDISENKPAMHVKYLLGNLRNGTSYKYLFWQIMWLAHIWRSGPPQNPDEFAKPDTFVKTLLTFWQNNEEDPNHYPGYNFWFDGNSDGVATLCLQSETSAVDILQLLEHLKLLFKPLGFCEPVRSSKPIL